MMLDRRQRSLKKMLGHWMNAPRVVSSTVEVRPGAGLSHLQRVAFRQVGQFIPVNVESTTLKLSHFAIFLV